MEASRPPLSHECVNSAYNISMDVTPSQGVNLLRSCLPVVRQALQDGIDYASELQPDPEHRDQYFWSHAARYQARQFLKGKAGSNWEVVEGVPNSGIHLSIGGLTKVRVLRSVHGSTPPPGANRQRRLAWSQRSLPAMGQPDTMILDWSTDQKDALVMNLGLPQGVWHYRRSPQLAWRVPLPSRDDLADLAFVPDQEADELVRIRIHETEMDVG